MRAGTSEELATLCAFTVPSHLSESAAFAAHLERWTADLKSREMYIAGQQEADSNPPLGIWGSVCIELSTVMHNILL